MSGELLQLTSVTKSFGAVRALKGVSFSLKAGEIHALLGENGAGKSTLIKIITGAHQPDSGRIEIDGRDTGALSPRIARELGIACIYQQPALFPDLSVAENIGLRLSQANVFSRVDWNARRQQAHRLLENIGAEISPEAEIRSLSMPQQQLVEIACALGAGARIVIMDEPTASLTQKETHLLFAIARELRKRGVGMIYISHRLEEIFQLADRVTVLRDGESIGTNRVDEMNEAALIKLMVGRDVSAIYPPAENEPGETVFSLKNFSCERGGVRDVSLDVRAGEIVGLAGLVGAGRTELARAIFGITPADSGEMLLNGQRIEIHSPRDAVAQGIAYVPEDRRRHGVILEMPIAQNMTMAIHRRFFPGTWLRFGAEKNLALEFIRDLSIKASGPDAPASSLSGGNQQKVALARWLAAKPKVLVLDEPTQGVDVGAKSEIHRIIRSLAKNGLAVLMISSDLPEIIGMSDRIAVMRSGTITSMLPAKSEAHTVMAAALGQKAAGE
ncbi:MAG TPA: sugar ABC transporter ATP-binding protein [Candidatus Angelobacter sp.]|nr:sugar ABC transporter ATP-binding protein [Candidatus Angelobacter sp.]